MLPDRYWTKVNKRGPIPAHARQLGRCWVWTASKTTSGYGKFVLDGRLHAAHRLSFGVVPAGLELDHLCRNRACVNPAHLEPVTRSVNLARGGAHGGKLNGAKTHCPRGHVYDAANTYVNSRGQRFCRTCHRACSQRRRHANRPTAS